MKLFNRCKLYDANIIILILILSLGQDETADSAILKEKSSITHERSSATELKSSHESFLASKEVAETENFRPSTVTKQTSAPVSQIVYFQLASTESILLSPTEYVFPSVVPETKLALSVTTAQNQLQNENIVENVYFSTPALNLRSISTSNTVINYETVSVTASDLLYEHGDSHSDMTSSKEVSSAYSHFHTPLMSLLMAFPSNPSVSDVLPASTVMHQSSVSPYSLKPHSLNNELKSADLSTVPADSEHKKLLMLVLRAEDCSRFSKADFEKILEKLMSKFGFGDVVPEISNAKCYAHLNINVTVGGGAPTLRFLPNIDGKNNITVDILNRTFRVVKLEKVDLKLEKTKSSNSSSTIIRSFQEAETVAYVCVGLMFGLFLAILIFIFCIKICCLGKPVTKRKFGASKSTHVRLRPEDYTLTPIPRPTSLYVDYYRGSATADIFSTTSAGSVASTTPTAEQGVIQPFDTSIVPLEDSSALPLNNTRDLSVDSGPAKSDLKTFNINSLSGKVLRNITTDSKEQLNSKNNLKRNDAKASGVANPTFQRY